MGHVTASLVSGTRVEISNGVHHWYADEPVEAGGENSGPTPYDLLLGGLAACTTLTLRYYANLKGIPLAWIRTEYEFDRVHATDCAECEDEHAGMIERIQAHVTLGGTFTEAERARLEQIVGRCPVHKTLANGMKIFDHVTFAEKDDLPDATAM
ncbi:MAG: OsmC family protein [Candidatus Kapaibacterium sp.]